MRYVWDMCGVRYANNLLKNPATKRLSGKILTLASSVRFALGWNAQSCHRYLEPNECSAPIRLLFLCTVDDLTPECSSRL